MILRLLQTSGLCCIALFLLPATPGASQDNHRPPHTAKAFTASGAIPMPADRADDSYAIYSMLMPGQAFASMSPEQNARWAISEITISDEDRNPAIPPQGQLKPPPDHPRRFQEAVGDYQANRNVRIQLTQKPFQINHPFSLLAPEQVNQLRAAKTSPVASGEAQSQWSGYPGITFFSEVYFDTKHTAALVFMNDWCANLCAAGSWIYLEKQDGHWQRRSGVVVPGA